METLATHDFGRAEHGWDADLQKLQHRLVRGGAEQLEWARAGSKVSGFRAHPAPRIERVALLGGE